MRCLKTAVLKNKFFFPCVDLSEHAVMSYIHAGDHAYH